MPTAHLETPLLGVSDQQLWDWHASPGAFERLLPPWLSIDVQEHPHPLVVGSHARLRERHGPVSWTWNNVIDHIDAPGGFDDRAITSPFSSWHHQHRFGHGRIEDFIHWTLPVGLQQAMAPAIQWRLHQLLEHRHRQTTRDLTRHARWAHAPRMTVGITGASGLVGTALSAFLSTGGHTVIPFVRGQVHGQERPWDPARGQVNPRYLEDLDAVIHLAGAPISGSRWTDERKEAILQSRAVGTRAMAEAIAQCARGPSVFVSASAVGIYGDRSVPVDESSERGTGFLADVCHAWETAAQPASDAGVRVVHPRVSIVQSGRGGALASMVPVFRWGLGAALGSGRQGMPWIALDDLVGVIHEALFDPRYVGPINAVSPTPIDQRTYARTLGRVLHRPAFARVPAPVVRALFGEMGQEVLLQGAHVLPTQLEALGYTWTSPDLATTLRHELGRI